MGHRGSYTLPSVMLCMTACNRGTAKGVLATLFRNCMSRMAKVVQGAWEATQTGGDNEANATRATATVSTAGPV